MSTDLERIEAYLAALPDASRKTLEAIRSAVRAAAPQAVEAISYGMPAFKHRGALVGYAAFKGHCSFFPMSPAVLDAHLGELVGYETAKGTIRFPIGEPLSPEMIAKIVHARIAENDAKKSK